MENLHFLWGFSGLLDQWRGTLLFLSFMFKMVDSKFTALIFYLLLKKLFWSQIHVSSTFAGTWACWWATRWWVWPWWASWVGKCCGHGSTLWRRGPMACYKTCSPPPPPSHLKVVMLKRPKGGNTSQLLPDLYNNMFTAARQVGSNAQPINCVA